MPVAYCVTISLFMDNNNVSWYYILSSVLNKFIKAYFRDRGDSLKFVWEYLFTYSILHKFIDLQSKIITKKKLSIGPRLFWWLLGCWLNNLAVWETTSGIWNQPCIELCRLVIVSLILTSPESLKAYEKILRNKCTFG